ncbi:MAG: hypothetical protein M0R28_23675 [Pigmentiphaga sp.]|nr:hypothetical protein [Pigmentiphaga sp.]
MVMRKIHDRAAAERRRLLIVQWCMVALFIMALIALVALDASFAPRTGGGA